MPLTDAKNVLRKEIHASNATEENKKKALDMIEKAPDVNSPLMQGAATFILAGSFDDKKTTP